MEEKKHPVLWIVTASLLLTAVVLFVLFRFVITPPPAENAPPAPLYTIREWQGQVAVFEGDMTYPKQIYDTPVSALPPEMRQRVADGVLVYSEEELSLLLEDYTG